MTTYFVLRCSGHMLANFINTFRHKIPSSVPLKVFKNIHLYQRFVFAYQSGLGWAVIHFQICLRSALFHRAPSDQSDCTLFTLPESRSK